MVNLVIVSHSALLGQGVGQLAQQMLMGEGCKLAIAAGIDDPDNPIGTDPIKVMEAIESVADTDHIVVMMDIGSALLSAETALELLDPEIAAKVRLCAAPLVEGTLAATVSAATGSGIEKVMADAELALDAKRVQLGLAPQENTPVSEHPLPDDASSISVVIKNPNGLHVRPASRLVAALAGFDAELMLEKAGKRIKPDSINQIALLQVRCNDTLSLLASGPEAEQALSAFKRLSEAHFGEEINAATKPVETPVSASGLALRYAPTVIPLAQATVRSVEEEIARLEQAIAQTLGDLTVLTRLAEEKYSTDIAAIFSGHHTLLDDPELLASASQIVQQGKCTAEWAWHQTLTDLSRQYQQLDSPYLQARYIDIDDLRHRTLMHLANNVESLPALLHPTVIIADDIFPSVMLQLDKANVAAVCLKQGSPHSHSAIIAREAGIVWRSQQGHALDAVRGGELLSVGN